MRSEKGYVLIIAVLVLAAAGISFAIANRSFFLPAGRDRELETKEEIELIVGAIQGNPRLRTFGYIGDMGRLPNTLSEINTKGAQAAFHNEDSGVRHFMSVGMGWNGVYVPEFFQDSYLEDAWGNDYVYTIETVAVDHDNDPSTATVNWRRARIKSNGPDHTAGTDDDITSENIWESGALYISPRKSGDFPSLPGWADSTLYSATNGEQMSSLLEGGGGSISYTDGSGNTFDVHAFSTVNHGPHAYELARAGQGAGKKNEQGVFNSQGGILKLIIVPIPE
ncbi:MAG: hypothetical protein V3V45_03235 [Candidatus Brocadiales bacterium]